MYRRIDSTDAHVNGRFLEVLIKRKSYPGVGANVEGNGSHRILISCFRQADSIVGTNRC